MKNFSDLIKENDSLKRYVYTAKVNIRGFVNAHDEGEAGELVDQEIDVLSQYANIDNYELQEITETSETYENIDVLVDSETVVAEAVNSLISELEKNKQKMSATQIEMFKEQLLTNISNL